MKRSDNLSLIEMKQAADEAGMTLFDFMKANDLLPDKDSPAYELITALHSPSEKDKEWIKAHPMYYADGKRVPELSPSFNLPKGFELKTWFLYDKKYIAIGINEKTQRGFVASFDYPSEYPKYISDFII